MQNVRKFKSIQHMQRFAKENLLHLVSYKGSVYDMTELVLKHPGGVQALYQYLNKEVDDILFNENIFKHSKNIIWTLEKFKIGYIINGEASPLIIKSPILRKVKSTRQVLFQSESLIRTKCLNTEEDPEVEEECTKIQPVRTNPVKIRVYSEKEIKI